MDGLNLNMNVYVGIEIYTFIQKSLQILNKLISATLNFSLKFPVSSLVQNTTNYVIFVYKY